MAVPLLAAAILSGLGEKLPRVWADLFSLAVCAANGAMCVALGFASRSHTLVHWLGGWRPNGGISLGIAFVIDPTAAAFGDLVALLTFAGFVYSWRFFDTVSRAFHSLLLIFMAAVSGFCYSGDLFTSFVFFELMSVAAYALTAFKMETPDIEGALNFAFVNTAAAFMLLLGLGFVYGRTGALNLAQIGQSLAAGPHDALLVVAFALIMTAMLTKAAIVPLHFWLADAHAVAPTPVSVLFSGIMVPIGLYGAMRIYFAAFQPALGGLEPSTGQILLVAGTITSVMGAVMCIAQRHLKRLLAFSTVSHMGLAICGFGSFSVFGAAGAGMYLLAHGAIKGALFLGVGALLNSYGSVDQGELQGRARGRYTLLAAWTLGAIGLAGIWPFGTFLGKGLMEQTRISWLPWLFVLSGGLTAGAVLRAGGRIFLGWGPSSADNPPGPTNKDQPENRPIGFTSASMLVLVVISAAIGLLASLPFVMVSAQRFVNSTAYATVVLYHAHPVTYAPAAEPASGSTWAYAAASLLVAFIADGSAAAGDGLDRAKRWSERVVKPWGELLERIHSGLFPDQILWQAFGFCLLSGAMLLALRFQR